MANIKLAQKGTGPEVSPDGGVSGVVIGELVGLSDSGMPLVTHSCWDSSEALRAVTTVPLPLEAVGERVVLAFEEGDPERPVVMGRVVQSSAGLSGGVNSERPLAEPQHVAVQLDDGRLTLTGEREITLKCGRSSITLTAAGKVLIKGAYLSSRSSGVMRIKGASIQLN